MQSTPTPAPAKELAPPKNEEVNDAVVRVFNKTVTVDLNYAPSVLVGDFNGDGSEDIAIAVKPNPDSLAEINSEFANWTLEDAKQAEQAAKPTPVKAERTDTLIAIIHGVGAKGWRNPEARQTFLLRNAAGTKPAVEAAEKASASRTSRSSTPRGDVISETINGHRSLIYWNGARYALRLSSE
jgi:FG-GAP repeat protein